MSERVVAWCCEEEWLNVYHNLFYGDVQSQTDALDVINIWRLRFSSKVPVAIEATLRLFESSLEYQLVSGGAQRQMMSAAVTQFVGLLTEKGLKGNVRKPIHHVGVDLGIPEWLINLRHEMAHGPLPALPMLHKAVTFAIDWLKENHWDVQAHKINSTKNNYKKVATGLEIWEQDQIKESRLRELIDKLLKEYLRVIIQPDFKKRKPDAIHTANKLISLIKKQNADDCFCSVLVEGVFLFYLGSTGIMNNEGDEMPCKEELNRWKPVLNAIKKQGNVVTLLCKLLQYLCKDNEHNVTNAVPWVFYVLSEISTDVKAVEDELTTCLKQFVLNCPASLSFIYQYVIEKFKHALNDSLVKKLNMILEIRFPTQNDKTFCLPSDTIYTAEQCANKTDVSNGSKELVLCNERFSNSSIGLLPGQNIKSLSEKLFYYESENNFESNEEVITEEQTPRKKRRSNHWKSSDSENSDFKPQNMFSSFNELDWQIARDTISLL
uniref:uncharacterized protein LOC100183975 n=1 Tax=Ciona intestinalis TaxID=7719 RepID=UPI000180BE3B|nr:uncharacterized protein LOC100183975 [Ciona intestinalis]|eukprot:XP_002123272.1 uncharacterized protein LOC100183975 [Ciona intestinalis]